MGNVSNQERRGRRQSAARTGLAPLRVVAPGWLPVGVTAVATLLINIAVLFATTTPMAASAVVPASTGAAYAVAASHVVPAYSVHPADRTDESPRGYRAGASAELSAIEVAGLTTRERLEAAAESGARARAQRAAEQAAAEQAAAEQHADSPTTAPDPAPEPAPAEDHHARAERAADGLPFDWRAHGITFKVGCHPDQSRCAWGTFDYRVDEVWLSPAAFASDARLTYVVAHELAHAWQWSTNLDDRKADLIDFGVSTSDGIEYGADCVAEAWGHPVATYWDCPSDAVAHMRSVFAATT